MTRADPAACPGRGTNKTSLPPSASRTAKNRPPGMPAYTSQTSSPGARITGQNGRGSAKQAVPRTAPSARTLSAYLHRHVTASGFGDGPFSVLGRASVCSLALIAAGSCERAAGSGGAKRPRSGAAGALDAAARERIMGCGGKGANRGSAVWGWRGAFLAGDRGDLPPWRGEGGEGQPGLPRPAGAVPRPATR